MGEKLVEYLQVKMGNVFGVQVVDAIQDLFEKLSGLLLAERLLLSQEVEEFTTCHTKKHRDTHLSKEYSSSEEPALK